MLLYLPENGRSVAFSRHTLYCSGSSICFHSSSVFCILSTGTPPNSKKPDLCLFRRSGGTYDCAHSDPSLSPVFVAYKPIFMASVQQPSLQAGNTSSIFGIITMQFNKSNKLANVCYDIRGPVLKHAKRLEEEGHRILKLNIGNPAPFGFEAPDEILQDVIRNLPTAQGYSDSKGLFSARKAVMQYYQQKQVEGVGIEDIYLGNGVSELIVMSMQALLNNGDEVLVPAPDYPLWTAAVALSGGSPVHYLCDEQANWWPDLDD
ncbi:Aminotransferase AlaT, partial [Pseudomonas coronafaciens pv. garcae]